VWLLSNATLREFAIEGLVIAVASMFYYIRKPGQAQGARRAAL
jgi:hypothetical protein